MNTIFITSMNEKYYEDCGELMLRSFRNHMPQYHLFVYNEDFTCKISKNIHMQGWNMSKEYYDFQDRWNNNRIKTFAKKGFSIIHALENISADRIVWVDADCHFQDTIPEQLLQFISPDNVLSSHFGVKHIQDNKSYFSCETGFFIVNKKHDMFKQFLETYKHIYVNDDIENLRRFYDGEVYGETVLRLQKQGAEMMELNPKQKHKTPIPRSVIAPYIKHYKAGVKETIDLELLKKQEDEI